MSFRSRLLLFFMIIVIVPMIAVALVLFSITADSETGKADAAIAQGLRAAFAVYDGDRNEAADELAKVARDSRLAAALSRRDAAAVRRRLAALAPTVPDAKLIAAYDNDRRLIASVGSPGAVAAAVAGPKAGGRRIGLIAVSTTTAPEYAREVRRVPGLDARLVAGTRLLASTLGETGTIEPKSGNTEIAGEDYRGRFGELSDAVGTPLAVGVFENRNGLGHSIRERRLLIGAILATFLLLALLSSIVVVRALQRQVNKFLEAARRLAHGDFTHAVPVEGNDEFAALGREFNAMSEQLASKIEEVQRKRGELEDTIRRVGEAFAAGLDRQEMVNIAVRTAVEACQAEAGRALPIDLRKMKAARVGEETPALREALVEAERAAFSIQDGHGADWLAMLDTSGDGEDPVERHPVRAQVGDVYAMAVPLLARL